MEIEYRAGLNIAATLRTIPPVESKRRLFVRVDSSRPCRSLELLHRQVFRCLSPKERKKVAGADRRTQVAVVGVQILGKAAVQATRQALRSGSLQLPWTYAEKQADEIEQPLCGRCESSRRRRRRSSSWRKLVESDHGATQNGTGRGLQYFEHQATNSGASARDRAPGSFEGALICTCSLVASGSS